MNAKGLIFLTDNKNKKNSNGGFYIALCCCVAAIGIVGFVNTRKNTDTANTAVPAPTQPSYTEHSIMPTLPPLPETAEEVAKSVTDAEETAVETETEEPEVTPSPEPEKTEPADAAAEETDVIESGENLDFYDGPVVESVSVAESPQFAMPAEGEICCGFSGSTLYYDSVMGDFRTHNGIDILAPADSDVTAAYDGTITDVYEDVLGKTVVVDHHNGFMTKYSNLDDISNLKPGTELKKGDFIAHVGTYALGENTTEPHLHFEIILNGEFVDPEEYID